MIHQQTMLLLNRTHPEPSRHRWYSLHEQPCLFGGVDVVRRWGQSGRSARAERREHFDSAAAAQRRGDRLLRQRRRAGYEAAYAAE